MIVERSDSFGRNVASDMIGEVGGKERRAYSQGKKLIALHFKRRQTIVLFRKNNHAEL
jgi:hypothetical protein